MDTTFLMHSMNVSWKKTTLLKINELNEIMLKALNNTC